MRSNAESLTTPHKGWHSRGLIPHFDQPVLIQSITFRLAVSGILIISTALFEMIGTMQMQ